MYTCSRNFQYFGHHGNTAVINHNVMQEEKNRVCGNLMGPPCDFKRPGADGQLFPIMMNTNRFNIGEVVGLGNTGKNLVIVDRKESLGRTAYLVKLVTSKHDEYVSHAELQENTEVWLQYNIAPTPVPEPAKLTFGMKLVGIDFNPSGDPKVSRLKQLAAEMANIVNDHSSASTTGLDNYLSNTLKDGALHRILDAQMWAVKHLTNKH